MVSPFKSLSVPILSSCNHISENALQVRHTTSKVCCPRLPLSTRCRTCMSYMSFPFGPTHRWKSKSVEDGGMSYDTSHLASFPCGSFYPPPSKHGAEDTLFPSISNLLLPTTPIKMDMTPGAHLRLLRPRCPSVFTPGTFLFLLRLFNHHHHHS